MIPQANPQGHLATRLEAVLRSGAEAIGCHAAALYLLDEATSKLKLRSCWGLPLDRLTAPARPLQGAVADLEALLGHAVVLEDTRLLRHWNVPEDFPAAACVPVSTPTTILGTLWVFSSEKRDLNDHQTNILEVVAGRVAADLEREMLWNEAMAAAEFKTQLAAAERLQRERASHDCPAAGRLGCGRLDGAGRSAGRCSARLVLSAGRPVCRGVGPCDGPRHRGRSGGQCVEGRAAPPMGNITAKPSRPSRGST